MKGIRILVLLILSIVITTVTGFAASTNMLENGFYRRGMQHENIQILQQALKVAGTFKEIETTQYYGDKTESAVMRFQQIYDLQADGIAGKDTLHEITELNYWPVLHEKTYEKGQRHNDIMALQAALHTAGFLKTTEFTDQYDDFTYESVKAFQKNYNLEVDGVVGWETIEKMRVLSLILIETQKVASYQSQNTIATNLVSSRGVTKRYGEYIAWSEAHKVLKLETEITSQDFYTGITFDAMIGHGSNHADIEPLTAQDTAKMLEAWGDEF